MSPHPVAPRTGAPTRTIAENQTEYRPIVAAVYAPNGTPDEHGAVLLTRWRLTTEERAAAAAGSDIYLAIWTFNEPLQPLLMNVGIPEWAVIPGATE